MEKKDVWSTDDIIQNRNNWSLAADAELLKHLQALSKKIITRSQTTLSLLNSFEDDVNRTCTSVANINNRFRALSDTQFIENKVEDENLETVENTSIPNEIEKPSSENITVKLKEALDNGVKVLHSHYHIIPVTDSDSDDEEPQEVLLKARNPYMSRRLPFIIGTEDFTKYDHLGLVTSSEEEEEEKESETSEDEVETIKTEIPKPQPVKTDNVKVIRISSSENSSSSEDEHDRLPGNSANIIPESKPAQTPYSLSEHLNTTLKNAISSSVPPLVDDMFTPPPFPTKDTNDYLSDDGKSDSSGDIFAASRRPMKHPVIDRAFIPTETVENYVRNDDLYSKEAPEKGSQNKPSSLNSRRSSTVSEASQSSRSDVISEKDHTHPPPKYSNIPRNNIFSAVNAELNAKLKINARMNDDRSSSDENDAVIPVPKQNDIPVENSKRSRPNKKSSISTLESSENSVSIAKATTAKKVKENTTNVVSPIAPMSKDNAKPQVPPPTSSNDIFQSLPSDESKTKSNTASAPTNVQKQIAKPKVAGLFDEDDSLDDLFKPSPKVAKPAPASSKDLKKGSLFDEDDLSLLNNNRQQRPVEKVSPKPVVSSANLLSKKSDLFEDDSDSGDDIFAIINSQKKVAGALSTKSTAPAAKETKGTLFSSNDDDLFGSSKSKPSILPEALPNEGIAKSIVKQDARTRLIEKNDLGTNSDVLKSPVTAANLVRADLFAPTNKNNSSSSAKSSTTSNENIRNTDDLFASDTEDSFVSTTSTVSRSARNVDEDVDLFGSMKSSSQLKAAVSSTRKESEKVNLFSSKKDDIASLIKPISKNADLFLSDEEDSDVPDINSVLTGQSKPTKGPAKLATKSDGLHSFEEKDSTAVSSGKIVKASVPSTAAKNSDLFESSDDDLIEEKPKSAKLSGEVDSFVDRNPCVSSESNVPSESTSQRGNSVESDVETISKLKPVMPERSSNLPAVAPRTLLKPKVDSMSTGDKPLVTNRTAEKAVTDEKPVHVLDTRTTDIKSVESENRKEKLNNEVESSVLKEQLSHPHEKRNPEKSSSLDDLLRGLKTTRNEPAGDASANKSEVSAIINRIEAPDEGDGNLLGRSVTNDSSSSNTAPGKLNARRGLNINVNALLPGSTWSKISKQPKSTPTEAEEPESTSALPSNNVEIISNVQPSEQPSNVLTSVIKERAKVVTRRRPPTRRSRINKLRQSDLFASAADSSDDEPDSAYKTASESNSPDNKTSNVAPDSQSAGDKSLSNENKETLASTLVSLIDHTEGSKTSDLFSESKDSTMQSETNNLGATESASSTIKSTLPSYTKARVKIPNRRPPSVLKKPDREEEIATEPAESTIRKETPPPASENKSRTVSHLEDDLFSASSSREPPVMVESDFKDLLDDSDEDDDLFSDMVFKGKSHLPSDIDSSDIASFPVDVEASAEKTMASSRIPPDLPSQQPATSTEGSTKSAKAVSETVAQVMSAPSRDPPKLQQNPVSSLADVNLKSAKSLSAELFSHDEDDLDDLFAKPVTSENILSPSKTTDLSKRTSEAVGESASAVKSTTATLNEDKYLPKAAIKSGASKPLTKPISVKLSSDLFSSLDDPEEDDDLFPKLSTASVVKFSTKTTENATTSTATTSGSGADLSTKTNQQKSSNKESKTAGVGKSNVDLFGDDDDPLFSSKKSLTKSSVGSKSFLFDDNDDDDLFGSKLSSSGSSKFVDSTQKLKPDVITEKARVVKLRSETVERDPLTGDIIRK